MLDLKEGAYVLDVGCGIGGSAFLMKYVPGSHSSFDVTNTNDLSYLEPL